MTDSIKEFEHIIKIDVARTEYWDWACKNLPPGTWKDKIPIMGVGETYCFKYKEDLLVFRLRFGL
jgi:hypothetical protein